MSTTSVPRKSPAKPISHTVEPHNRPYDVEKLNRPVQKTTTKQMDKARAAGFRRMAEQAKSELASLTAPNAIARMRELPRELLECFLIVEETHQARPLVLRNFPKPGSRARGRYTLAEDIPVEVAADDDGQEN